MTPQAAAAWVADATADATAPAEEAAAAADCVLIQACQLWITAAQDSANA